MTDPPYELSNDGKQSAYRVFLEFMFPQDAKVEAIAAGNCQLASLISQIAGLCSVGGVPSPSTAMPIGAVALNDQIEGGQHNVKDSGVLAVSAPHGDADHDGMPEAGEYLGCFALKLADSAKLFEVLNQVGAGFYAGGIGIGFGFDAPSGPSLSSGGLPVVWPSGSIWGDDRSLAQFVSALPRAKDSPVLGLDLRGAALENCGANSALTVLALCKLSGAKLVRASATARDLPAMFKALRVSHVFDAAGRAVSFDIIVHPQDITSTGFMGKAWDGSKVAYDVATWRAVYNALKPGAHLVAFSGTRTYHRMACAIEDAGFEIRDQLAWTYGSGFPKSLDVSKAIDKAAGAEREVVGVSQWKGRNPNGRHHKGDGKIYGVDSRTDDETSQITAPATPDARKWQGYGTAIKPAWEPICLARKPLSEKTVAANVLKWGTGALNVDGCRVAHDEAPPVFDRTGGKTNSQTWEMGKAKMVGTSTTGRFPANIIHDGSDEVLAGFPETGAAKASERGLQHSGRHGGFADLGGNVKEGTNSERGHDDNGGSAARFFYSAKAGPLDRIGSSHATVKPVDVMRWLARLVTPKGGLILEPFAGSGTTGIAAMAEGFDCHMVELLAEHCADIERKLAYLRGEGASRIVEHTRHKKPTTGDELPLFAA